jgi:hypothetical protein
VGWVTAVFAEVPFLAVFLSAELRAQKLGPVFGQGLGGNLLALSLLAGSLSSTGFISDALISRQQLLSQACNPYLQF